MSHTRRHTPLFQHRVAIAFVALVSLQCVTGVPPSTRSDRFPVHPRAGWKGEASAWTVRRIDTAWSSFLRGDLAGAKSRFGTLARDPALDPAKLGLAAIAIEEKDFKTAEAAIASVLKTSPDNLAALVFRSELDAATGDLIRAEATYREVALRPDASAAIRNRAQEVANRLFEDLTTRAARTENDDQAIELLRKAVEVRPASAAGRLLLVDRLTTSGRFDEARAELEPLIASNPLDRKVQRALAEIDIGRMRFQEAIRRLETLIRQQSNPSDIARLEEVKKLWNESNMPAYYQAALKASAVTREDLAVLVFWKLSAVRFATSLGEPPIVLDIEGVRGREELLRAFSLRLFTVDEATREARPHAVVGSASVAKIIARLAVWIGVPCAAPFQNDSVDSLRTASVLEACGLDASSLTKNPAGGSSGAATGALLDQLELLASAKK